MYKIEIFLGCKKFKYFLGCLIFLILFLVNSRCWAQAYVLRNNESTPPPGFFIVIAYAHEKSSSIGINFNSDFITPTIIRVVRYLIFYSGSFDECVISYTRIVWQNPFLCI